MCSVGQWSVAFHFSFQNLAARGVSTKNVHYYNKDRYNVIDGVSADFQSDSGLVNTPEEPADQTRVASINSKDSEDRFCSLKSFSSTSNHSKTDEHKTKSLSPRNHSSPGEDLIPARSWSVNNDTRTRLSEDTLKCPKCDKEYSSDEHADLLDHIEICCE